MITVDSNGNLLNPNIVRETLFEMRQERKQVNFLPEKAVLHPIQALAITDMYIPVGTVVTVVKTDAHDKIPDHPMTLAGIPILQLSDMDESTIEFRDLDGKAAGRIINLGIPVT